MAKSIYVPLPTPAREALFGLAEREWRDPREQAAMFVVEGLRRAGALTEEGQSTDAMIAAGSPDRVPTA